MKLITYAKMYNELEKIGYDMDDFLGLNEIESCASYKTFNEDLKTLKKRYPCMPEQEITRLCKHFGAIITDSIIKEDYFKKGEE